MFTVINGQVSNAISVSDRGFQYGDGVFETVRYEADNGILFDYHMARFQLGAKTLKIRLPSQIEFNSQLDHALSLWRSDATYSHQFICKWIVTRGQGGRGYKPDESAQPSLIFSFSLVPDFDTDFYNQGIDVIVCDHPLGIQPRLAEIKHLNRLDQVLASLELGDYPEGLMCDLSGNVIEGTKSNLLFFKGDKIITPGVTECGVNGCLRQYLLDCSSKGELQHQIATGNIPLESIYQYDSVALINSVFGLWPVATINSQRFGVSKACRSTSNFIRQRLGL